MYSKRRRTKQGNREKHSPTTRQDSTAPSSYSVLQLETVVARSLSLCDPVSPHQLSLSGLSHGFKISLSLPPLALSAMPIPPSLLLLLLLCWPLSLSLARLLAFPYPLSLSLSHSVFSFPLPLAPCLPSTPAFCFAAVPLPAHLFCLSSSSSFLTQIA